MLAESSAASGTRKLENTWNQTLFKLIKGNGGLKFQGCHVQDSTTPCMLMEGSSTSMQGVD
jgi:hypothetical protein